MTLIAAERSVQLGNSRVRVREHRKEDGGSPPLLLLNGLGAPLELWTPLLKVLQLDSIAFDAPGSGCSQAPSLPMSIGEHARLALDLLDHLGVPRADVLGLSFGGMVAQELAHLAPSRIERMILASTSCGWGGVPSSPAALLTLTTPESYYAESALTAGGSEHTGDTTGEDNHQLRREERRRQTDPAQARGYIYQFWAAAAWSSLHRLPQLSQPVLVLAGDADPIVPPINAQILAAALPNARKHIVAHGGHLCLIEHALELAPLIGGFLSRDLVDSPAPHTVTGGPVLSP